MRILMLGNSLTSANDLPRRLANALRADVTAHTRGGAKLAEQLNPKTEMGARTLSALQTRHWDFVVIQGAGTEAVRTPERFRENAVKLCEAAKKAGAKPVLFVTWGYRDDGDAAAWYAAVKACCEAVAEQTGAILADVGADFLASDDPDSLYAPDGRHPAEEGTRLALERLTAVLSAEKEESPLVAADDARVRILRLYQLLAEMTDEDNMLTGGQIRALMRQRYGIEIHRTTLPRDMAALREAGIEIMSERGQAWRYYLSDRAFSVPELRVLIDAVQSSKFITARKSGVLTEKLMSMTSKPAEAKLRRAVHATGKSKSDNEKGYYIVDAVNEAILEDRQISFYYFDYDGEKRHVFKNDGEPYVVSPYDLLWDGDYYYLIGWCEARQAIRVFRMDRIERQPELLNEKRVPPPKGYRIESYTREVIRMYGDREPVPVTLECDDSLMKHVVDRFGLHVETRKTAPDRFAAFVKVSAGPTFFRWVFGWGGLMRIVEPDDVVEAYRRTLTDELKLYD